MKILTTNLQAYKKLYDQTKVTGNAYYEYVFLDFVKQELIFMNESAIVKLALSIEDPEDRDKDFLFVDGSKFFFLATTFPYLEIKGKSFYSPEGNRFVLQTLDETLELPEEDEQNWSDVEITLTEEFMTNFLIASDYIDKESVYSSMFFEKDKMIVISENKYLQIKTEIKKGSFEIPLSVVRVLSLIMKTTKPESFYLKYRPSSNGGKVYTLFCDGLTYFFSTSSEIELPVEPESKEFIDSYIHENFFTFGLHSLYETAKTLSTFVDDASFSHCRIEFLEKEIQFNLQNGSQVEYRHPILLYSDYSYFEGKSFWISLNSLKQALSILDSKKYSEAILRFDENAPVVYLSSLENEGIVKVVQTLLEEPNL